MIVGIGGSVCAGKASVANWLIQVEGFRQIRLCDDHEIQEVEIDDDLSTADCPERVMTADACMQFVMTKYRWRQNWVVWPLKTRKQLETFRRRPFFMYLGVEAPLMLRFHRFLARMFSLQDCALFNLAISGLPSHSEPLNLEEFVTMNDDNIVCPLSLAQTHPDLLIMNDFAKTADLYAYLSSFAPSLTSAERLRPSWDDYFMLLADLAARRSNCMKRQVGCILVRKGRVLATGYNGTPKGVRNCSDGGCDRCNRGEARCGEGLSECLCLHAEENALLEAGRERIDDANAILYCNTCPCLSCAKKIIQAGVREVVYRQEYGMDALTSRLFGEAGVRLRQHSPLLQMHLSNRDASQMLSHFGFSDKAVRANEISN